MTEILNPNIQHTIAKSISVSGTGLHSGIKTTITLIPAEANFGLQFQRIDLIDKIFIKADCDLVTDTSRGTTLEFKGIKISTIEHLLAALVAKGIDNCLIQIDGVEVPILDGSSYPFIKIIEEAGIKENGVEKIWYYIDKNIKFYDKEKDVDMYLVPNDTYEIFSVIDFNSPVLGNQTAILKNINDFKEQISRSRTFCFLHELEQLLKHNLIKGGDLNNAIVIVDKEINNEEKSHLAKIFNKNNIEVKQGYLNNLELNYPNEPARHKLLDIVGDLALIGYPIKAKIFANKPGHKTNVEFAKQIKQYIKSNLILKIPEYNPNKQAVFNTVDILNRLPHRFPFLLVDKIIELNQNSIVGIKNITFNEPFFPGHFPGNPILPGVLQVEALAQTGGILALNNFPDPYNYDTYFVKIDQCKFKHKIVPGDTMIMKMEFLEPIRRGLCIMKAQIFIGNKLATEAILTAQIIKTRNDIKEI